MKIVVVLAGSLLLIIVYKIGFYEGSKMINQPYDVCN